MAVGVVCVYRRADTGCQRRRSRLGRFGGGGWFRGDWSGRSSGFVGSHAVVGFIEREEHLAGTATLIRPDRLAVCLAGCVLPK